MEKVKKGKMGKTGGEIAEERGKGKIIPIRKCNVHRRGTRKIPENNARSTAPATGTQNLERSRQERYIDKDNEMRGVLLPDANGRIIE